MLGSSKRYFRKIDSDSEFQNVEIDPRYPTEKYICPNKDEKTLEEPRGSSRLAIGYFDSRYV